MVMVRACAALVLLLASPLGAQTVVPSTFVVLGDYFDGGTLENWVEAPGSNLGLSAAAARNGSAGLGS